MDGDIERVNGNVVGIPVLLLVKLTLSVNEPDGLIDGVNGNVVGIPVFEILIVGLRL